MYIGCCVELRAPSTSAVDSELASTTSVGTWPSTIPPAAVPSWACPRSSPSQAAVDGTPCPTHTAKQAPSPTLTRTPLSAPTPRPLRTLPNRLEETIHPARCARPRMHHPFPKLLLQLFKWRVMRESSECRVAFDWTWFWGGASSFTKGCWSPRPG